MVGVVLCTVTSSELFSGKGVTTDKLSEYRGTSGIVSGPRVTRVTHPNGRPTHLTTRGCSGTYLWSRRWNLERDVPQWRVPGERFDDWE